MTYIKDLIEIPERIGRGDFVLRLSEGVTDPKGTVDHYQVTPQLVKCFDEALGLVKGSLQGGAGNGSSKAAYLHGSFGSGKSHFMAILHLILSGDAYARSIPELADTIAKHSEWMEGKRFLMVPYHLLGAEGLESAILGGYSEFIERTKPTAPTPAVYKAGDLLVNAEQQRKAMGDAKFFELLNVGNTNNASSGGWGDLSSGWDAVSYAGALKASHSSEECRRLVRDLVDTHFPAMKNTNEFVSLDDGLAVISSHAKEIGYDGVVLFLDELILWLASHAGDQQFLSREGNKVVKLVESSRADRPVPLVSFIARQRDLRDLIGKQVAGAEKLAFADVLDHHEGRFSTIKLEDRNLPAIAQKRILLPLSKDSEKAMDDEFSRTQRTRVDAMKLLTTRQSSQEDFRKLYPFSPALVDTLVVVSSLLQRERTALKVMAKLLSDQRETLKLGEIVPVGDLFDQVAQGDEAFSSEMKSHFENANRLYNSHLKPLLEDENDLSFEDAQALEWDNVKRKGLRNDDRLVKTLLLAALVPEVEALKNMTPQRLAALNHGTIVTPVPGMETTMILNKFKKWAAKAGQIKIQESAGNSLLSIQLSSIDTSQILSKADSLDNRGNRIQKLKELTFEAMGRPNVDDLFFKYDFKWRGTPQQAEIVFANIRELSADSLQNSGGGWKVIVDYPFDDDSHSIRDDLSKINDYLNDEGVTSTICWLPSFFNNETIADLGTLVRLEQVLKENQFANYVQHLNEVDRESARAQLRSQKEQLRSQLKSRIEMAYGIRSGGAEYLDSANSLEAADQFRSLNNNLVLQAPVVSNLEAGLYGLLDQALRFEFPGHPNFEESLSLTHGNLTRVLEVLRSASQSSSAGILIDQRDRKQMLALAGPLKLGEMGEQRFQEGRHWRDHFNRKAAQTGGDLTVADLRRWIDEPNVMGLPNALEDLIILSYAEATNRIFKLYGGPVDVATIGSLKDEMSLEEVALPTKDEWDQALKRVNAVFGLPISPLLNAANVEAFSRQVLERVQSFESNAKALVTCLEVVKAQHYPNISLTRLETAREAVDLLQSMKEMSGNVLVAKVASSKLKATDAALGISLKNSTNVSQAVDSFDWAVVEGIPTLSDGSQDKVDILNSLEEGFAVDELAVSLRIRLKDVREKAVSLLTKLAAAAKPKYEEPTETIDQPDNPPIIPKKSPVLRKLYGTSQIKGEILPDWLSEQDQKELLEVHDFGKSTTGIGDLLLVGPLYKSLIDADPAASVDLAKGTLTLPKFGKTVDLNVVAEHLEA